VAAAGSPAVGQFVNPVVVNPVIVGPAFINPVVVSQVVVGKSRRMPQPEPGPARIRETKRCAALLRQPLAC
jgi:hypothetical protein